MLNARPFRFWNDLPATLRTGKPQNETRHGGASMFEELYSDTARLGQFMHAMTGLSRMSFEVFAAQFPFAGHQSLCDVGAVPCARTEAFL